MSAYVDTNVLVSAFAADDLGLRALSALRTLPGSPIVSDFTAAEFSSSIARLVRMHELTADTAREIFSDFDLWIQKTLRVNIESSDITEAEAILRRLDIPLKTPDALHVAAARRLDVPLLTFDRQLGRCATELGVPVAPA